MLQRRRGRTFQDLSPALRESRQWKASELRRLYFPRDITALAYEPVTSLLVIGTAKGLIHIFGRPGVHVTLELPSSVSVKFLVLSAATSRLACLDDGNQLSIWDLSPFGRPQFLATARFDQTNCILTSPSHSHVFLATHPGEVKTYDLLCLRKSPYILPNLWDIYKRKANAGQEQSLGTSVEVVAHPRDLNLLFVAYAGGVILSDLTQRDIVRAYEYTISPGAPGGSGYESQDVLTLRQPSVTCMAVHPAGHFFVVGYADGTVAFWALEDEDQPLLVKTLDEDDVNVVNKEKLEQLLSTPTRSKVSNVREPVFKLSWSGFPNSSDPRGGKTVLTILGGQNAREAPGLTVFELPSFNPADPPPSSRVSKSLHPHFRSAMRESFVPLKMYFYPTQDVVQDYLLIPRDNPHYSGSFDPVAIILMTGSDTSMRCLSAFEFPPPAFKAEPDEVHGTERLAVNPNELADELEATLRSLMESDEPKNLRMPAPLSTAATGLANGHLLIVDRPAYQAFVEDADLESRLALRGGHAWADTTKENDLAFAKYQPHRLMATLNQDSTVHFFDLSAQLLSVQISNDLRPKALEHEFPEPIPALTIDISAVFGDPHVASLVPVDKIPRISSMEVSLNSACVIGVETGQLIIFRVTNSTSLASYTSRNLPDAELIPLGHIKYGSGKRHEPYLMVSQSSLHVEASSIADIGLLAVSYSGGTMLVVDMRAAKVILRKDQPRKKHRNSINFHLAPDNTIDPAVDLVWSVCPIEQDLQPRLRLLAVHLSGHVDIITFAEDVDGQTWRTVGEAANAEAISNPLQHGSFIVDARTGALLGADRERYFLMTQHNANKEERCFFVSTGLKGAKIYADVDGQRVSKTNWSNDSGYIQSTQIVERMGSHALVALTDKHLALVYSLPQLEHLHTLELPPVPSLPPGIDRSGDFLAFSPHPISGQIYEALYGTLFDFRRVYSPPDVELISFALTVPSQPQPVTLGPASLLGTWFRFGLSMSGDQLDALLGGPQRPVPEAQVTEESESVGSQAAELASKASAVQNELYGRLTSAIGERGHILEDLGERFNSLEAGSRNMVTQAKRLAAQQSAKSWFGL